MMFHTGFCLKNVRILDFLIALYCYTSMHIIFVNNNVSPIAYRVRHIIVILTFGVLVFYIFSKRKYRSKRNRGIIAVTLLLYIYMCIDTAAGESYFQITNVITTIILICLYKLDNIHWKNIFEMYLNLYVFVCAVGIVITLLNLIGIDLFWGDIYNSADGSIYHHYRYSLLVYLCDENLGYMRFCSIFNEPGVVGTTSALLLAARKYDFKDKKNIVIFLAGLLSFSTAFFMLMAIYYCLRFFIDKFQIRKIIIALVLILSIVSIDVLLYQKNETYTRYVHDKIVNLVTKGESNRVSGEFDNVFTEYLQARTEVMFGMGGGSSANYEGSSVLEHFYDYGIVGSVLFGAMLWSIYRTYKKRDKNMFYLFVLYLASLYQRPYVFNAFALLILYGGLNSLYMINRNQSSLGIWERERYYI